MTGCDRKFWAVKSIVIIQKYWDLWTDIYWFHQEFENPDDQIEIIKRSLMLDYSMFNRSDIAAYAAPPNIYEDLVRRLLARGKTDEALKYLKLTVENLEQMKQTENKDKYDSIMMSRVSFKNCTGCCMEVYESLENGDEYDIFRNNSDFLNLLSRIEKLIHQEQN